MSESETAMPSEEQVYEALEEVIDPELGLDFVSLGLVYGVEIEEPEPEQRRTDQVEEQDPPGQRREDPSATGASRADAHFSLSR